MTVHTITGPERAYLRELAKKQREYANLPVMKERERLWYLHNELRGERPMVVMEEQTFLPELLPPSRCESPLAKTIEAQLCQNITVHELIDDDKMIPAEFFVYSKIDVTFLGQELKKTYAESGVGYHIEPVLEELERDLAKLSPSTFHYDQAYTEALAAAAEEALGDLLPVTVKNSYNYWGFGITQRVVDLMGMENMFCAMVAEPEDFHRLMRLITDDFIRCLRWQEENGLLRLNNGNDYMGSGSFCFTRELPGEDFDGNVRSTHLWGHINSQESVGVSPEMYHEFIYPYFEEMARQFGLVYYGCCEPVHDYWDRSLHTQPNLRKVSISPWCDGEFMSERLRGGRIIYSRKPSPNFLGVHSAFDEEAFTAYIANTARLIKGCKAEFIFRDIYQLGGNLEKVRRAVEITRRAAENVY